MYLKAAELFTWVVATIRHSPWTTDRRDFVEEVVCLAWAGRTILVQYEIFHGIMATNSKWTKNVSDWVFESKREKKTIAVQLIEHTSLEGNAIYPSSPGEMWQNEAT